MSTVRLTQKEVFYPFFGIDGRSVALLFDFTLFGDGKELVSVPVIGAKFTDRFTAYRAMMDFAAKAFNRPADISKAAHSQAWSGETRHTIGFKEVA